MQAISIRYCCRYTGVAVVRASDGSQELDPWPQRTDNAIHRINLCSVYSVVGFDNTYPLKSDYPPLALSGYGVFREENNSYGVFPY